MLLIACSLCRSILAPRAAQPIRPWLSTRPVNASTTNNVVLHRSSTTSTGSAPCGMERTRSHIRMSSVITGTHECTPKFPFTGFITGEERSTLNVAVAPTSPTGRANPDPEPAGRQSPSQSGESRSLSVIFFAISALLTLATIVVAIVYGAGAARATKRLLNALTTNMRESSRATDVEMGDLHSPTPSIPSANASQTFEDSFVSTAALV